MNNKLEVCINCQIQCRLQDRADAIVAQKKSLTISQVSQRVSVMSLRAKGDGCPISEVNRTRQGIAQQIDPVALSRYFRVFSLTNRDASVKLPYYGDPLPTSVLHRRDSLRNAKTKHRP